MKNLPLKCMSRVSHRNHVMYRVYVLSDLKLAANLGAQRFFPEHNKITKKHKILQFTENTLLKIFWFISTNYGYSPCLFHRMSFEE